MSLLILLATGKIFAGKVTRRRMEFFVRSTGQSIMIVQNTQKHVIFEAREQSVIALWPGSSESVKLNIYYNR